MITFKIEYSINGRKVDADRFGDEFMAAVISQMLENAQEQFREQLQEEIEGMKCFQHQEQPTIEITLQYDDSTGQITGTSKVNACCQEFANEVAERVQRGDMKNHNAIMNDLEL